MEIDANLEGLRDRLTGDRPPIALVGAGVSVPMGYPSWSGLIKMLHQRLGRPSLALQAKKASGQRATNWYSALKSFDKDPLWQAEAYEQALPEGDLAAFIQETFGERPLQDAHRLLGQLPFRHYLTTNFDPSIELSLKEAGRYGDDDFTWCQQAEVTKFLLSLHTGGGPRVAHLHGKYDNADSLVLTERDYVDRYIKSDDARRKLLAIFLTYPVVFIGFSMDDPDLSQIMREVAARLGRLEGAAHHYGIFGFRSLGEKEAIRRRMQEKFGVCVIFYPIVKTKDPQTGRRGEDHSGLVEILNFLRTGERPPPDDATKTRLEKGVHDDADPQKGRWGGLSSRGGFKVTVEKLDSEGRDWVEFALVVRRDDGRPFSGRVTFHLHDSFTRSKVPLKVDGKAEARLVRWAYGAFTVGVEIEGGPLLEIDLAEQEIFPGWFRSR